MIVSHTSTRRHALYVQGEEAVAVSFFHYTAIIVFFFFFFLNDPATTEIYPLPLHDALPISIPRGLRRRVRRAGEANRAVVVAVLLLPVLSRAGADGAGPPAARRRGFRADVAARRRGAAPLPRAAPLPAGPAGLGRLPADRHPGRPLGALSGEQQVRLHEAGRPGARRPVRLLDRAAAGGGPGGGSRDSRLGRLRGLCPVREARAAPIAAGIHRIDPRHHVPVGGEPLLSRRHRRVPGTRVRAGESAAAIRRGQGDSTPPPPSPDPAPVGGGVGASWRRSTRPDTATCTGGTGGGGPASG